VPPLAPPAPYHYLHVPSDVAGVLRAAPVHRLGHTGRGVHVGMIDTGLYPHPYYDFHGYRRDPVVLGAWETAPNSDFPFGHGTAVAANVFAIAPDVRLRMIKGYQDLPGALQLARTSSPALHVLSISLGDYGADTPGATRDTLDKYYRLIECQIAKTVQAGIVVCVAAGNQTTQPGPGLGRGFPASHPDVIAVGGVHVNYDPTLPGGIFGFEASNYASSFDSSLYPGRHVPDICGLVGRDINNNGPLLMLPTQSNSWTDIFGGDTGATDDGWVLGSGTSSASPQVAGVAALMKGAYPTLTPADIRYILAFTARDITVGSSAMGQPAGPGADAATGAGLVDALGAISSLIIL
jgi:serine protease AprX